MLVEMQEIREDQAYLIGDCQISRAYEDEACVMLPCGYRQRFFIVEQTDEELIETCKNMKNAGIGSASFPFDFIPEPTWPF